MTAPKNLGTKQEQDRRAMRLIRGRCDEVGDCWLWKGAVGGRSKLPCIHHKGKTQYVRRVVYDLTHDEPAGRRVVTPKCTNPKCVSPKCLEAMPRKEALQAAGRRGAYSRQSKVVASAMAQRAKSRYSDELIAQIRASEDGPLKLSRATGMSLSHIKAIRRGSARRDFTNPFAGMFSSLIAANDHQRRAA